MNLLLAAILAEHAKLRRTLARASALAAPFIALMLSLFVLGNLDALAAASHAAPWQAYVDALLRIWAGFLLPLMATLQAVLLAQLEHGNRQWKYLLTLPVPREYLYAGKAVNLCGLIMLGHLALWGMGATTALIAGLAGPGEDTLWPLLLQLGEGLLATFLGAFLLAMLQLWLAMALESFIAAIAIGLVATLASIVAAPTLGAAARWFPWSMPLKALDSPSAGWWVAVLAAGTAVWVAGAWRMRRMQVR